MPDPQTPPADGPQGDPKPDGNGNPEPKAPEAGKTFTEDQVNAIVADRVKRAVPKDYEDAKAKAARLDAIEEQSKSDLQKAQDAANAAIKERDEARTEAASTRRATAIQLEAARQGADSDIALALLASSQDVGDDGSGAKEAVERLIEQKPNVKLTGSGTRTSGGQFGGTVPTPIADQIRDLEKKGDRESLAEARRLKIAGMAAQTS